MEYFVIDPTTIDPDPDAPTTLRSISEIIDLESVTLELHTLDPGEELPPGYHSHETQETVLFVIWGTLDIETPEQSFTIDAGNLFVVKPGQPYHGANSPDASRFVEVLRVSAPAAEDVIEYSPDRDES